MTKAERQRLYRQRRRAGLMVVRVEIDGVAWAEALIAIGLLAPADYDNAEAIGAAMARCIAYVEPRDA